MNDSFPSSSQRIDLTSRYLNEEVRSKMLSQRYLKVEARERNGHGLAA
jgi:hypothetical protein